MLDIKRIKDDPEGVKAALRAKEVDCDAIVDRILELDELRRTLITDTENRKARQNKVAKEPAPKKEPTLAVDYVAECEKNLSKQLGRGVRIVNDKRKGRFELEFYGEDDLQNLLDALMKLGK